MIAIVKKEIVVVRNKEAIRYGYLKEEYFGMNSRITTIKLLGIPIYKKEEFFN